MKKLSAIFMSVFVLLVGAFMSACGGQNVKVKFTDQDCYVEMYIGDELKLTEMISVEGAEVSQVSFVSLDTSIVGITDGSKLTAQKAGATLVVASVGDAKANLEVKVLGNPTKASAPLNLRYDTTLGAIVWDSQFVNVDGTIETVNSYDVEIVNNGQTQVHTVTGDNKFAIQGQGEFVVRVKCNQRKTGNKIVYGASDYCPAINLTKLPKPYNLKYENGVLSWEADALCKNFQVRVNGIISEVTSEKQLPLVLATREAQKQEVYQISVIAVAEENSNKVFVSSESDTISRTRLYAPSIYIKNGIIRWDDSQKGDFHYEIALQSEGGMVTTATVANGEYSLTGISAGKYTATIKAVADTDEFLNSENISKLENVEKLDKVALSFDVNRKQIIASGYEGKVIRLSINHNTTALPIAPMSGGRYSWDYTEPGKYTISAMAIAQQDNQINSDASNVVEITQIATLSAADLTHSVNEKNEYVISFVPADGADVYDFVAKHENGQVQSLTHDGEYNFGNADLLFPTSGRYTISITASSSKQNNANQYTIPSVTVLEVYRHEDVELSKQESATGDVLAITWEAFANVAGYEYILTRDAEETTTDITLNTTFATTTLMHGRYEFKLKALGVANSGVLYLGSLNYATITFPKTHTLAAPVVVFDRETSTLVVTKVDYATSYDIKINNVDLPFDNTQEIITIDISKQIQQAGVYTITVVAKNADNELIFNSEISQIQVVRHEAPNSFTLTGDGLVIINDYPNASGLDTTREEILINDVAATTLGDGDTFVVKAKFIAKKIAVGTTYYLDSNYSTFDVERVDSSQKPEFDGVNVTWTAFEEPGFAYVLHVLQNGIDHPVELETNSFNIFEHSWIDLNTDFSVAVEYKFSGATINLPLSESQKYSSKLSEYVLIQKVKDEITLTVTEEDGVTTINWTPSVQENVTYELFIDEVSVQNGTELKFETTTHFAEAKVYTVSLQANKQGWISSDIISVYVERLKPVEQLNISADEEIEVVTDYKLAVTGEESSKNVQLEQIIVKNNSTDITSLAGIDGMFEVKVLLVAKQYTSGQYFYLSSEQTTFKFNRISTPNAPKIENYVISWDNLEDVHGYNLRFQGLSQEEDIDVGITSNIRLDDEAIQNLLSKFKTDYTFEVSVRIIVNEFTAQRDQSHMLSSSYSNSAILIRLADVTDVIVRVADTKFEQTNLVISWQHTDKLERISGYVIEILKDGESQAVQSVGPEVTSLTLSDAFIEPGVWQAKVTALGQSNAINSYVAESAEYTRLASPTNLSIDNQALLTWNGIATATSYVVSYYHDSTINGIIENITNTSFSLAPYLTDVEFDGKVVIKVMAVGGKGVDLAKTFSSAYSESIEADKLRKAGLEITPESITVTGDYAESDSLTFVLTISTDNRTVKTVELVLNETYTFEDWTYADTKEKVPTNVAKQYNFLVQAFSSNENSIKSDSFDINATKLKSVQNLGFYRDGQTDSVVHFKADSVENASHYHLTVGSFTTQNLNIDVATLDLAVSGDFERALEENFEITIYAQGEIGGAAGDFINSSVTSISGTKLPTIESFVVQNGKLTWNKVDGATDYNLRLSETEIKSGYVTGANHTLVDTLEGKVGKQLINIRAIGNVGKTFKSTNIVLDSSYIRDESFELANYEVSKLEIPTQYQVVDGYLAFQFVENADMYSAVIGDSTYELVEFYAGDEEISKMFSEDMYNTLSPNQGYEIAVMAQSYADDTLYSDPTATIKIKILDNFVKNTLKITKKIKRESPTVEYDYTVSQLVWTGHEGAVNGYNVVLNDEVFKVEKDINQYVLDPHDEMLGGSENQIYVTVAGSSGVKQDGYCYLNSRQSEVLVFVKLETPMPYLSSGELCWTSVEGANGYIIYLDGVQFNQEPITTTSYFVDLGSLSANKKYSTYEVRAISTSSNAIASTYGIYEQENDEGVIEPVEIIKLKAPKMFNVSEGEFRWTLGLTDLINFATSGLENPITTSIADLEATDVEFKFTGTSNGAEFEYLASANDFVYCTDSTLNSIKSYGAMLGLSAEDIEYVVDYLARPGWPSLTYHYDDMGAYMLAGEYDLSIRQPGNSYNYLTSNYGPTTQVYIPHAPQLQVKYFENQGYVATWSTVTMPAKYGVTEVEYVVVAETTDMVSVRGIERNERVVLATTKENSINLTELVNDETIDSRFINLFVYVKGNNNNVLNGKMSNQIALTVLEKVSAFVHNGELVWNGQIGASGYRLYYYENENSTNVAEVDLLEPQWDCVELLSIYDYYHISIKALGVPESSTTEVTITGKLTDIGKLKKLETPVTRVNNGVFEWENIDNSTSYNVYAKYEGEEFETVRVSAKPDSTITYETTFDQEHLKYHVRAIGSLDEELNDTTLAYINSSIDNGKFGSTIPTVTGVETKDGKLVWDIAVNAGIEILDYKLTFVQVDESDNEINEPIIVVNNTFKETVTSKVCTYDCSALVNSGYYKVYIQAFYTTEDARGTYMHEGETAYYLMSLKSEEYRFTKYDVVEEIKISNGTITWRYAGQITPEIMDTFRYKLVLSTNTGLGRQDFEFYADEAEFSRYIIEELIFDNAFTLTIQVVPKEDVTMYISSEKTTYKDGDDEDVEIYQVHGIQVDEISIFTPEGEQDLFITWADYETGVAGLSVEYIIGYWNNSEPEVKYITTTENQINTSELAFTLSEAFTLYYQIQVIPKGEANYLPSYIHEPREIQKPAAPALIMYDTRSATFSWDTSATSSDHSYKIKDSLIAVDETGKPITDEEGEYQVIKTYMYTTSTNLQNVYAPIEQGYHVVSVAIVVKNASGTGGLTSSYTVYYNGDVQDRLRGTAVAINLFAPDSGIGTSDSPYHIKTKQQFANMVHRIEKFEYQNTYILEQDGTQTKVTCTGKDTQFNFKQVEDIVGVASLVQDETTTFYGTYDGDYHTLSWVASLEVVPTRGVVSLFDTLAKSATIKNVNVLIDVKNTVVANNPINLSGVAHINNGTIENVLIGDVGMSITILNTRKTLNIAMVTNTNNGLVTRAVNRYSVTLGNTTSSSGPTLAFAGAVYTNNKTVSYCANYANFSLTSSNMTAGGVVAINSKDGSVIGCTFKAGSMVVDLNNASASTLAARVGGVVGQNNQGAISHCYAKTDIKATKAGVATTVRMYIGGLVGATIGTNITYSFVNVTRNASSEQDIYQFVGTITSPTLNGDTCFYKENATFLSGSDGRFVPKTYTVSITGLNANGVYFTETVTQTPDLLWESDFDNIWKAARA